MQEERPILVLIMIKYLSMIKLVNERKLSCWGNGKYIPHQVNDSDFGMAPQIFLGRIKVHGGHETKVNHKVTVSLSKCQEKNK